MKTYPVLNPIRSGKKYMPGDTIELDDQAAAELLACGAIGPAVIDGEPKGTRPNSKDSIKLIEAAKDRDALYRLAEGEDRKTVLDALDRRLEELVKAEAAKGQA